MTRTMTNRVVLAPIGLILLGGGLLVLAAGTGVYRHWDLTPPDGWPLTDEHNVLIPRGDQVRWAGQDWWWPASIATLAAVLLLALAWLLSQVVSRQRHRALVIPHDPQAPFVLSNSVLGDALTEDLDNATDIRHARVTLDQHRECARARVDLELEPDSDPASVLHQVAAAIERARTSIRQKTLPADINIKIAPHHAHRVD